MPLGAVRGQRSAGYNAMHVRVQRQLASPGVQYGGDAELTVETFRVASEIASIRAVATCR